MAVTRDQVFAYADAHPEATVEQIWSALDGRKHGPSLRTMYQWVRDRKHGQPPPKPPEEWDRKKGPRTHAKNLPETDRAAAVARVRRIDRVVDEVLLRIERALEEHPERAELSNLTVQAVLNLTRAKQTELESYPGLMELVKAEEGATSDERVLRRARLLGQAAPRRAGGGDDEHG